MDGRDYHFIATAEFEKKIEEGEFLEYAEVFGNYYGTSRKFVEAQQEKGKHVILVIDTQGAMQLKGQLERFLFSSARRASKSSGPASTDANRKPKRRSNTASPGLKRRWRSASHYDYHIVNENLKIAYESSARF